MRHRTKKGARLYQHVGGRCCLRIWTFSVLILMFGVCISTHIFAEKPNEISLIAGVEGGTTATNEKRILTSEEKQWLLQHDRQIRIGITEIPPQVLFEKGKYKGLSVDYLRHIERKLGCTFTLVPYATWNEVIQAAKTRQIDVIFAAQQTPERLSYLLFTEPYIELPNMILVRKHQQGHYTLQDMNGWTVAVSEGSAVHEYLARKFSNLRLRPVPDERTGLLALSLGEVDAMVVEISRASYYIEKEEILNLRIAGDADLLYQLRFAVRSDWPILCEILNKGLSAISEQERRNINRRWIAVANKNFFASRTFLISTGVGFGIIILIIVANIVWNRSLRSMVKQRTLQLQKELSERKRAESEVSRINRVLRMLSDSNQALIHIQDEIDLLSEICRIAIEVGGYRMAWVGFAEHDEARTVRPMAQAGFAPGYLESAKITWSDEEQTYSSPCGIAIRTRQPKLICNILSDPSVADWKEAAIQCGYQSVLALPLICDGRTIGSLGIYADQEDVFDSKELEILKELASDLAFGISALRIRKERDQVEAALRESQAKYIDLYENAPDMYVSINAQTGLIEQCNRTLADALGYSKEDIIGRPVFAICHPDCLNEAKEEFRLFLKTGSICDKELQLQKNDGSKIDVSLNVSSVHDEKGRILYSRSTLRDITQRKRSEEILQRLNRELMAISECNQALLRAKDEQTLLNDICRIVCEKAGYQVAWAGFAEHDADKTIRPVAWAGEGSEYIVNTKLSWSESSKYGQGLAGKSTRTGQAIYVQDFLSDPSMVSWREIAMKHNYRSAVAMPLKDEKKQVFGIFMIYSSQPNILTPKEINLLQELSGDLAYGIVALRIRAKHKQIEEALAASERDFRSLAENSPDNIVRYDRQCRAIYCNPITLKTLAISPETFLGKTPTDRGVDTTGHKAEYEECLRRVLESGESRDIEILIQHPEGGFRNHLIRFAPERDKDGNIIGALAIGRDITERKQAEQEREKLLRDLNAKNKELQSIVYISSHDLKTPLVNIKGFSHLLKGHCRQITELVHEGTFSDDNRQKIKALLEEDVPEDLGFVSSSADRMNEMIDGLLRVSRIGVREIQMKEIDMNKMMSKIYDIVKYPADAAQVEITIDPIPNCVSDEDLLKQLFLNLIDNAIKYLDPGRKGRIRITGSIEGDNSLYCVEDNGIGIAAEHQSKIFELYHRLNPEDPVGGEGLGLTIVSRILDRINGHIHVESELGKGSRFFVSLPCSMFI